MRSSGGWFLSLAGPSRLRTLVDENLQDLGLRVTGTIWKATCQDISLTFPMQSAIPPSPSKLSQSLLHLTMLAGANVSFMLRR
jgi:hypothetical protein